MDEPPKFKSRNYKIALVIEFILVIWGFASASAENYGTTVWFSAQVIVLWLPTTLVVWFLDRRRFYKQLESSKPAVIDPAWQAKKHKIMAIVAAVVILYGLYALIVDNHPGNCSGTESFPDSVKCHFKS